jgi:arylsulfatase A-like enzyme
MKIAALLCAQLHLALLWHALPSSVARALSRRGAIAVASVGLLALVPVASDHLDSDGNLQFAAMEKLPHVAEGVTWLRVITDFDGDGFSAWFGGGDCANGDPATHPGALDLPDNGRDEDCSGRDATLYRDTAQVGPRIGEVPSGLNVLLVTVDTLRADHLGSYGYPRATSPHIDALAGAGIVYERAYAQASSTERSLPSLLTGRYPSNIPMQLRYRRFPRLDRQLAPTLARAATQTRRLTAAFGQGGILRRFDLDRDFEIKGTQRFNSAEVTEHALGFLASHRRPFLLWLHYADPHEPYRTFEGHDFGQEDIDRYDSSIAHTDALIGRLLEFMSENGLMSSTMIVLTADHGEEFGEHGGRGHASHLYGEVLHVPLIVYFPGAAPTRVPTVVELVDVAPTVLAALGAVSTTPIDGGDLLRPDEDGHAVGEVVDTVVRARSLTLARWKIIQNTARNTIELYDLAVDPTEQRNVAHLQPGVTALLSERLAGAAARAITVDIAAAQDGDAEAQSRLARALPYLTDDTLRREIAAMLRAVDDVSVQFHVYSARQTP